MMKCKYCNAPLENGAGFCTNCGQAVPAYSGGTGNGKKKTNGIIIALICVCAALFLAFVAALVIMIGGNDASDKQSNSVETTKTEEEAVPEESVPVFDRYTTYYSGYTYKNMPDIHSSVPSNDYTCLSLQDFICEYNDSWIEFINNNDTTIYTYLRPNTYAYNYAVEYSHKDITEEFELVDVNDVRQTGNTYYVWVHEKINEYSNEGVKNQEYHWVYKIGQDVNGYYVENYTADPFYK